MKTALWIAALAGLAAGALAQPLPNDGPSTTVPPAASTNGGVDVLRNDWRHPAPSGASFITGGIGRVSGTATGAVAVKEQPAARETIR